MSETKEPKIEVKSFQPTPKTDDFIPYNQREEWKDITPIPQDDGPHPVVPIAYSKQCKKLILFYLLKNNR